VLTDDECFSTDGFTAAEAVRSQVSSLRGAIVEGEGPFDSDLGVASLSPTIAQSFFAWAWAFCTDVTGRVTVGCCGTDMQQGRLLGGVDAASLTNAHQYAALLVDAVILASNT